MPRFDEIFAFSGNRYGHRQRFPDPGGENEPVEDSDTVFQ
jgi:hypothetical protein